MFCASQIVNVKSTFTDWYFVSITQHHLIPMTDHATRRAILTMFTCTQQLFVNLVAIFNLVLLTSM